MGDIEVVNEKPVCTEEGWAKAVYWEPNTLEQMNGSKPTIRLQRVNPRQYMQSES